MNTPEMQFRTRSKIITTRKGNALTFGFRLGPLTFFIIANLPEPSSNKEPLVYIKMNLRINDDWKEYSAESSMDGDWR